MLPALITLGIVLMVLDIAALWLWIPAYYRHGIPLSVESRRAYAPGAPPPSPEALHEALQEDGWCEFLFRTAAALR